MSERYETYQPAAAGEPEDAAPAAQEQWVVVVEYSNRGDAKPPTVLDVLSGVHPTRAEAFDEAARQAVEYNPPDPMSPRRRRVLEVDGGYLVVIDGAMSTFHITIRPARVVGEVAY